MRRLLLAAIAALVLSSSARADQVDLKKWVERALPRCPASSVLLEPIERSGPQNFTIYRAKQITSDEYCGSQKYVAYSPMSGQVVMGTIIPLPTDARPANVRLAEQAGSMLKAAVTATISEFPLPDGLREVSLTRTTPFGPFPYRGYIDMSKQFLLVGLRGNVREEPSKTLRSGLQLENGARRGSKTAPLEIIEMSDFQCPTCGRAHEKLEPLFAKNLSKINYIRLDLPLFEHHEWAMSAALAARAIQKVAPAKYWRWVDQTFKNQEQMTLARFDTYFRDFVSDNDINWPAVQKIYTSTAERNALLDQISRAFAVGIASTPTFIINGQPIGFGDGTYAEETLKRAIGMSSTPAPAKKSSK